MISTEPPRTPCTFVTYHRDGSTGLDYASDGYYSSIQGRFLTADPYLASGGPADPGSWNRYAYVKGDPVNYNDPNGTFCVALGSVVGDPWPSGDGCLQLIASDSDAPARGGGGGDLLDCYGNEFDPTPNPLCYLAAQPLLPPLTPPSSPDCSLKLEYRHVPWTEANHSALVVRDTFGFTFTMEGFPTYLYPLWGNLIARNTPSDINNEQWGKTLTSSVVKDLCERIGSIEGAELYYSNHPVGYWPAPGPNSNTFAHWLLENGGPAVDQFFSAPPDTTGWDYGLYGHVFP